MNGRIILWGVVAGFLVVIGIVMLFKIAPRSTPLPQERTTQRPAITLSTDRLRTAPTSTLTVALASSSTSTTSWTDLTMSAWLIRSDLTYLTYPEVTASGATATLALAPLEPGSYRLVLEGSNEHVVSLATAPLLVSGPSRDLPPPEQSATRNGFKVTPSTIPAAADLRVNAPVSVTYRLTKEGSPVTLDAPKDIRGDLVAFRENGTLFVHAQPLTSAFLPSPATAGFTLTFPEAGRYRLFFSFMVGGQLQHYAHWVSVLPAQS